MSMGACIASREISELLQMLRSGWRIVGVSGAWGAWKLQGSNGQCVYFPIPEGWSLL